MPSAAMSFDRPFVLAGQAPDGHMIRPQQYRDEGTAEYVARVLRRCGYRVAVQRADSAVVLRDVTLYH